MTDSQAAAAQVSDVPTGPKREILIVLPGLLLTLIIAMLDQLVVSTALPRIVGDLGGLNHLAWVVTAYILASTVTTLLYGKLGDMYGRKRFLMIAIVLFLIGSALSGLSHTMDQLIAFRALQGLGAGGLMVGAIATIGDMVSPRERGQYMGYMMAAMMLAMIAGPLVGGYITSTGPGAGSSTSTCRSAAPRWSTCGPPCTCRASGSSTRSTSSGAAVIAIGASADRAADQLGRQPVRVGLLADHRAGGHQRARARRILLGRGRAAEPMLPLHVFKNRNFSLASGMSFLLGMAMLGAMTFLPLYQQTVQRASPTVSGLLLIPMMLGSTVTSLISGQVTSRTGRYKILPIIGAAIMTVAMFLLTHAGRGHHQADLGADLRRARRRHGLPDADHVADRAEQRAAEGHGRGQQLQGVLPADRRLDGRLPVRRDLHQQAELGDGSADRRPRAQLQQPGPAVLPASVGRRASRSPRSSGSATVSTPCSGWRSRSLPWCSCWPCSSRRSRCGAGSSPRPTPASRPPSWCTSSSRLSTANAAPAPDRPLGLRVRAAGAVWCICRGPPVRICPGGGRRLAYVRVARCRCRARRRGSPPTRTARWEGCTSPSRRPSCR